MSRAPKQRRSELTRHRVIDAAIEAFGMEGFERTSTRALVERAGTNLVSIHYHFGGKEALYLAAATHIASTIREHNRAAVERGRTLAADPDATRDELVDGLCSIYDDFAAMVLAGGMPECWRRFMTREQTQPTDTDASAILFRAVRPFFDTVFALVARVIDRPAKDPEVRLLAMMIFGQVSVFRTNRASALRLLGWQQFGPVELRQIRTIGRKYIVKLLSAEPGVTRNAARAARARMVLPKAARTRRVR